MHLQACGVVGFCHQFRADIFIFAPDFPRVAAYSEDEIEEQLHQLEEVILFSSLLHRMENNILSVMIGYLFVTINFNVFSHVPLKRFYFHTFVIRFDIPALADVQGSMVPMGIGHNADDPADDIITVDNEDVSWLELPLQFLNIIKHLLLHRLYPGHEIKKED